MLHQFKRILVKKLWAHTCTINSPSWSFWTPPTFIRSATLSYRRKSQEVGRNRGDYETMP